MRVIEQLVQHFWQRGALTRDEAAYLVRHGFVREADLAGFGENVPAADAGRRSTDEEPADDPRFDPRGIDDEQLEDKLTGRNAGGGKKGGKKKPAGHNLAPAANKLGAYLNARKAYPALLELGSRLGPCATWRDGARRVAAATPTALEQALVGLLTHRPPALGELWFWFELDSLFVWAGDPANAGPVADGIGKLLRADVPARVGRLDQLKKAPEVQELIDLLAARRPFLSMLPALYERYFDRLGLWLVQPGAAAAHVWPSLPWTFVLIYNALNGTVDDSPDGYPLALDNLDFWVIRDALRTAFSTYPAAIRELLLHHIRERPDSMPDQSDLVRNMVFDRPIHCPYAWRV